MINEYDLILNSKHCIAITGAGVSVDSGIPDFRSDEGFYKEFSEYNLSFECYEHEPKNFYKTFWKMYNKFYNAKPNLNHMILDQLMNIGTIKSTITQNIDGLQIGGFLNFRGTNCLELHGNIHRLICKDCKMTAETATVFSEPKDNDEYFRCNCGAISKPDITLYGESISLSNMKKLDEEINKADVILVLGSSLSTDPINFMISACPALLIIVNKSETCLDHIALKKIDNDVCEFLKELIIRRYENKQVPLRYYPMVLSFNMGMTKI